MFTLAAAAALLARAGGAGDAAPPVFSAPAGDEAVKASIYRPGQPAPAGPTRLVPGPYLFLDDALVESSEHVVRHVHRPARDPAIPNPVITGKEDRCFQPYLTVLRDGRMGRFRVWYDVATDDKNAGASHIGTMESADGIHWSRPVRIELRMRQSQLFALEVRKA